MNDHVFSRLQNRKYKRSLLNVPTLSNETSTLESMQLPKISFQKISSQIDSYFYEIDKAIYSSPSFFPTNDVISSTSNDGLCRIENSSQQQFQKEVELLNNFNNSIQDSNSLDLSTNSDNLSDHIKHFADSMEIIDEIAFLDDDHTETAQYHRTDIKDLLRKDYISSNYQNINSIYDYSSLSFPLTSCGFSDVPLKTNQSLINYDSSNIKNTSMYNTPRNVYSRVSGQRKPLKESFTDQILPVQSKTLKHSFPDQTLPNQRKSFLETFPDQNLSVQRKSLTESFLDQTDQTLPSIAPILRDYSSLLDLSSTNSSICEMKTSTSSYLSSQNEPNIQEQKIDPRQLKKRKRNFQPRKVIPPLIMNSSFPVQMRQPSYFTAASSNFVIANMAERAKRHYRQEYVSCKKKRTEPYQCTRCGQTKNKHQCEFPCNARTTGTQIYLSGVTPSVREEADRMYRYYEKNKIILARARNIQEKKI